MRQQNKCLYRDYLGDEYKFEGKEVKKGSYSLSPQEYYRAVEDIVMDRLEPTVNKDDDW